MKFFYLTLISLLAFVDPPTSFSLTINQNLRISNQVSTIILNFDGALEIIETNGNEISIETQLISAHESVLEYQSNKRLFNIVPAFSYTNQSEMILKPKKNNTSIFVKGEEHKTIKKYKLVVPAHIKVLQQ